MIPGKLQLAKRLVVLFCFLLFTNTVFSQDDWESTTPPSTPEERYGHTMVTLPDGRVMLFGGEDASGHLFNDLDLFNGNGWNPVEPNDEAPERSGHSMTTMPNGPSPVILVFGGKDANGHYTSDVYQYDIATGQLTQREYEGDAPAPRANHNAFEYNDELYVLGGRGDGEYYQDVWAYNRNTNSWTQKADAPYEFSKIPVGIKGNRAYAVKAGEVYEYNMETDTWSKANIQGEIPSYREGSALAQIGDKLYSFGGFLFDGDNSGATDETLIFDMNTLSFSTGAVAPVAVENPAAATFIDPNDGKEKVAFFGGQQEDGTISQETYVYTPPASISNNWQQFNTGTTENLNAIGVVNNGENDKKLVAVGDNGTIYSSSNSGATWMPNHSGTQDKLNDIAVSSDGSTMATVGDNGTALFSTDAGSNWFFSGATSNTEYTVKILDGTNGPEFWTFGGSASIYKTSDLGSNWNKVDPLYQFDTYTAADVQAPNTIHIGGEGSYYKSTDAGQSWNYQDIDDMLSVNGIYFVDENIGYMIGPNGGLLNSTDGGDSWSRLSSGPTPPTLSSNKQNKLSLDVEEDLNSVFFIDKNSGIIVGDKGTVLLTKDGGNTWTLEDVGVTNNLTDVKITEDGVVYITGEGGVVITNQESQEPELYSLTATVSTQEAIDAGCDISVTPNQDEYESGTVVTVQANPAEGWEFVEWTGDLSGSDNPQDITIDAAKNVIAVFMLSTDVENNNEIPTEFSLSQNYPNPFNPTTSIEFQVACIEKTIIKVYDVLGNEVQTLINGTLQPGIYKVQFNAGHLSSGVYFYKLQAGKFVQTRKLLLMK